ncbi:hypothetical protein D8B26_004211 [Coccidioides posadasii str. Silveira]|uniref:Uncharacterized protein n=1 Tax=Coccidioides posadasii (strain RMSCC 757 / Silveira) TaxID=443226 RepID=E9DCU3_COCPS|nr:conserved hypothetical protein [Coccidioides posadasii str. Silveira]QVM09555.1 hypothetical protein D8B26_004211 [Coccidioides posadasii str. Silveira]
MAAPLDSGSSAIPPKSSESLEKSQTNAPNTAPDDWDSERRLVLALAQLQEMETKIQKLRTLVPTRLWSPLVPMIAEKKGDIRLPRPKSPQELFDQLGQAAREGNEEIEAFRAAWRSPEMQATWDHVNGKIKESGGNYPRGIGMWQRDYNVILKQLDAEVENKKEEEERKEREEEEMKLLASIGNGWRGIVESFATNEASGLAIKVIPSPDNTGQFSILLRNVSLFFFVQQVNDIDGQRVQEWRVTMEPRAHATKLGQDIFDCIQSRDRKWDLKYLLNFISSYSNIKAAPCIGCNSLIDSKAQLPVIRKPKLVRSSESGSVFVWEPFHPACV